MILQDKLLNAAMIPANAPLHQCINSPCKTNVLTKTADQLTVCFVVEWESVHCCSEPFLYAEEADFMDLTPPTPSFEVVFCLGWVEEKSMNT